MSIGAVVMGFDPNFNYYKACFATALLIKNPDALFIVTNQDVRFPSARWTLPGTGECIRHILKCLMSNHSIFYSIFCSIFYSIFYSSNIDDQSSSLSSTGSFVSVIETATGRKGVIAGKPGPVILNEIQRSDPHLYGSL